jgi:hypothetical protein
MPSSNDRRTCSIESEGVPAIGDVFGTGGPARHCQWGGHCDADQPDLVPTWTPPHLAHVSVAPRKPTAAPTDPVALSTAADFAVPLVARSKRGLAGHRIARRHGSWFGFRSAQAPRQGPPPGPYRDRTEFTGGPSAPQSGSTAFLQETARNGCYCARPQSVVATAAPVRQSGRSIFAAPRRPDSAGAQWYHVGGAGEVAGSATRRGAVHAMSDVLGTLTYIVVGSGDRGRRRTKFASL